ncbi:hypothetical protein LPUS_08288 [Lasallia pustulata]|uniref:Protein sip5 n=1 Tax=Lasallia pustulata TaxID=136370 RepID=A0A1W5D4Z3_9LECA|nr:hypothetical protein LPUS_08288 [Lasallia pustulata]
MGNAATKEQKEQRPSHPGARSSNSRQNSSVVQREPSSPSASDRPAHLVYNSRHGRGSRPDLASILGMGSSSDKEATGLETRKETKQEREARKLAKERVAREKERERSMREESVDGGFLVTQGVYTGIEDYNKGVVRQLMIERRVAPFWRGLNDHSDSWTENQLVAAARGLPIPAPDEIPTEELLRPLPYTSSSTKLSEPHVLSLTVPISSRSQSYNSDSSSNPSPSGPSFSLPAATSPLAAPSSGSTLFRGRSKTLAALTTPSKNVSQAEMTPREMQLPKDPFVNGQRIEAYLYKDAMEFTTDRIRPDWAQKLSTARAHAARRSAAATALHTAAYLMGNRGYSTDARILGGYGRRGLLRRASGIDSPSGTSASAQLGMLALMSERYTANQARTGSFAEGGPIIMAAPPRANSRRNRVDDLEDMMMMEAIRLSLAAEEERRKREEKEAKKEAKKKEKENKKAEKVARKAGVYQSSAGNSDPALDTELSSPNLAKGKAIDRGTAEYLTSEASQTHVERDRGQLQPSDANPASLPYVSAAYRPSHLRNLSNVSSSASSMMDSPPGSVRNGIADSSSSFEPYSNASDIPKNDFGSEAFVSATPGGGAGTEPMFNFQSLAAMIGEEDKIEPAAYPGHENVDRSADDLHGGESSMSEHFDADAADGVGTLGQSIATLRPDDATFDTRIEAEKAPPEVQITVSSRSNSLQDSSVPGR